MKREKKNMIIVLLLLLLAITAGFAAYTYAKYTSSLPDKSGTASVAKWDFVNDNSSTALVPLMNTYNANTLVDGKIAPGTQGQFSIHLTNTHTDVGVNYNVSIGTITGKPTNLKFYSNSQCTDEIPVTGYSGTLSPNDSTGVDVVIYWKWAYETSDGDEVDTTAGAAAANLTIPVQITGTQVQPTIS